MAKYIKFPAVIALESGNIVVPQIYNSDTITLVRNEGAGKLEIYCGLIKYRYNIVEGTAEKWVNAINEAILTTIGPILTEVVFPYEGIPVGFSVINIAAL